MAEKEEDVSIDAPLISSHNDYLLDQTNGYQKASLINEQELTLIRQFEIGTTDKQQYVTLFLALLNKLSRVDTLQSILVLIDDFIQQDGVAQLFLADQSVFSLFNKLLSKEDEYIQLKAAKIMIFLLGESHSSYPADPTELFTWVVFQLASTNSNVVDICLQFLQSLLAINMYRKEFVKQADGVLALLNILNKAGQSPQVQYQAIYSIWLLSFVKEIAADLEKKYHVIPVLRDIAKSAIKEKVVRIVISTFKNMLINAPTENIIPMLGHKLLGVIETLSVRKWSDPEITEDLMYVREELSHHVASLSTFDEYSTEVLSRRLEWSPPHLSEQFWKLNSNKLNDNQFELVKLIHINNRTLVDIIKTSEDPTVLSVAAYDLGQYCKYANNAKK
ncbi:H(+)-transporting V1 sector ATPase subunit H [Boothiomyces macroporosus]|uniref:H(+)-transporting V1 sector ATPase subunit H n=1 Tax=Boothiomyces macroporosus TaxID=261099 RepID=A0AAD5UMN5_9FUNG|nr:H(+)-transporting V1 sector ATPase subunit H [Boothiomyces macroporosus]